MTDREVAATMKILTRGAAEFIGADEVRAKLKAGKRPLLIKCGFDPTAQKAHVGHLVQLLKLRDFQDAGHKVALLLGSFTAMLGDPTGKSTTRPALAAEVVRTNAAHLLEQLTRFLVPELTTVVYNDAWLGSMSLLELVSWSRVLNVSDLTQRRDFRQRIEDGSGLSLGELLYPVLQGYDSVQIVPDIEVGGVDQLLNCMFGRKMMTLLNLSPQAVLTMPLLPGLDGSAKMGKSDGNTIDLLAPAADTFGKVMSIRDESMPIYYRLLCRVPEEEVASIESRLASATCDAMALKKRLAREIVQILHGPAAALEAERHFEQVVQRKDFADVELPEVSLAAIRDGRPNVSISDLLIASGLAGSRSAARRLLAQGAIRVNGERVAHDAVLTDADLPAEVRAGKRRAVRVH